MSGQNVLIVNMHGKWDFSPGNLNRAVVERMKNKLETLGYEVQTSEVDGDYDVASELEKTLWADIVIHQIPVNWMGVPWKAKKYIDEVYMTGISGDLCNGDGRSAENPTENYGTGGTRQDTKYMISLTFNAPRESFGDQDEWFFRGKGVDDLFFPHHLLFRFMAMEPLDTFAMYDVLKNPQIEADFDRLDAHLEYQFAITKEAA